MARILVINDDHRAAAVRDALTAAGHVVQTAASPVLGPEESHEVALVVLPVLLPGKDSLHTLQELRSRFVNVPIITVTGRAPTMQDARLLEQLGATRILEHPFHPLSLLALVAATLRQGNP